MANLNIEPIYRNLYVNEDTHTYEPIEIIQGTNGGVEFVFDLYKDGQPYQLQNDMDIKYKLIGARPDGNTIIRYPKSVSGNRLIFGDITTYMTCIAGTYNLRIEMADINGISNILVNDIQVSILTNSFYNSGIISTDEYSVLMYELNHLDTLINAVSNISNESNITEAGYALDARQNNPDIEGTLASKVKSACDGVDALFSRLYTGVADDTDGRTLFSNDNGLSVYRVYTNNNAPKSEKKTYIVVSIREWDFIQQTWYSLWSNEVYTRVCNITDGWRWSDWRKLTNV